MALPQTQGRLSEEPRGVIEAPVLQVKSYLGVRAELGLALGSPTFSKDRAGSTAAAPSVFCCIYDIGGELHIRPQAEAQRQVLVASGPNGAAWVLTLVLPEASLSTLFPTLALGHRTPGRPELRGETRPPCHRRLCPWLWPSAAHNPLGANLQLRWPLAV